MGIMGVFRCDSSSSPLKPRNLTKTVVLQLMYSRKAQSFCGCVGQIQVPRESLFGGTGCVGTALDPV